MLYNLEQGEVDIEILKQAWKSGRAVPERIADAPMLMPWLDPIYAAFSELGTCRNEDGAYIPWTAIHQYAQHYGFAETEEDFTRFLSLIRAMDNAYIKYVSDKRKKADKAKPLGPKKTQAARRR